jgi:UDP-N-acetylglucosamine 2-epimerase (non-hydrolysing)
MKKYSIDLICGARPNIMKIAPLYHELSKFEDLEIRVIHTGQHNSDDMYLSLIQLFKLPDPGKIKPLPSNLNDQKCAIAKLYLHEITTSRPDISIVVGDVTSSMVCSLVAKSAGIKLAHVEAGLRNFDRYMPEEINRTMIDKISDLHFTPSKDADENLFAEGFSNSVHLVGNIMIDSYYLVKDQIDTSPVLQELNLKDKSFGLVTIHRQSNVDDKNTLFRLMTELEKVSESLHLVVPLHPRTKSKLTEFGLEAFLSSKKLNFISPQNYINFMKLLKTSKLVITDSGGVQEETTYLGIPCLTIRKDTERPITISKGTNKLVDVENLQKEVLSVLSGKTSASKPDIEYWDGKTAERIAKILISLK